MSELNQNFLRQKINTDLLPRAVIYKWSSNTLTEGFVPFPKKLLRCITKVFDGPKAIEYLVVVLSIADYRRPQLSRNPSIEFLAFNAGFDVDTYRERLQELKEMGLVSVSGEDSNLELDLNGLLNKVKELTEDT